MKGLLVIIIIITVGVLSSGCISTDPPHYTKIDDAFCQSEGGSYTGVVLSGVIVGGGGPKTRCYVVIDGDAIELVPSREESKADVLAFVRIIKPGQSYCLNVNRDFGVVYRDLGCVK